jgi:hypothetical protein
MKTSATRGIAACKRTFSRDQARPSTAMFVIAAGFQYHSLRHSVIVRMGLMNDSAASLDRGLDGSSSDLAATGLAGYRTCKTNMTLRTSHATYLAIFANEPNSSDVNHQYRCHWETLTHKPTHKTRKPK